MNILVIGAGGREHAIIWALHKSPNTKTIFANPGNAGIDEIATNVSFDYLNKEALQTFCNENAIELVVVGPEAPLVEGVSDLCEAINVPVFGPSKRAAVLEESKEFTKDFCIKYNIPTAAYQSFSQAEPAKAYINECGVPIVVKADGLAAGKGVIIAQTTEEAHQAVDEMLAGKFGEAGNRIVIEECLEGEEISVFALCDGKHAVLFGSAQDHKRVGEGDTGPNTGGMGTYSPAPIMTPELEQIIMEQFIQPTIDGMAQEDRAFKGVLFAGFMITESGPKLLEYNVRFGDPETQSLMVRLESDLPELMLAAANGELAGKTVQLSSQAALCVVLAANGYPGAYQKGTEIKNLSRAESEQVIIFHAGTKKGKQGKILASGGRVLGVTAKAATVKEAQQKAYQAVDTIDWSDGFCRRDIGWRAA